MKNVLKYYYNLIVDKVSSRGKNYYFSINNSNYIFVQYMRPYEDIGALFALNKELLYMGYPFHEIILNKDNIPLTSVNNKYYVLLQINVINSLITPNYLTKQIAVNGQNKNYKILYRTNWIELWTTKIDYFEYQLEHFKHKYPLIIDSINYFIGLGENAISYVNNTLTGNNTLEYFVSHKRLNTRDDLFFYYNPLNLIIDYKIRDIAEYLKSSFLNDDYSFIKIERLLMNSNLNETDYKLLYGRLLFPSFYFDIYDQIINGYIKEKEICEVIKRADEYEEFLYNIFVIIKKHYNIDSVDWLIKKFN